MRLAALFDRGLGNLTDSVKLSDTNVVRKWLGETQLNAVLPALEFSILDTGKRRVEVA